ncbi:MAG: NUDIX domain-containing protein [Patescibacteria group bacterium]|nr:NUDIX domain-containing protein [Patescibacteria group bacterium]MCL5095739.1 NUDIX domain-containing protein [Patescibacteria group bacterium]
MQTLILVDKEDKEVGFAEREETHKIPGKLHRAILVIVKNDRGQILLARRSLEKTLWPGIWDGTVATHVFPREKVTEAAARALKQELGIEKIPLKYLAHFIYQTKWGEEGVEYEFCHLLEAKSNVAFPQKKEISEIAWVKKEDLNNYRVSPWFLEALKFV